MKLFRRPHLHLLLAVMLAAAGCTATTGGGTARVRDASPSIKITSPHYVRDSGTAIVVGGTVANHAREDAENVVLTARVYGGDGRVMGEGVVALEEALPAMKSRSFRIAMSNVRRGRRAALAVTVTRAEFR